VTVYVSAINENANKLLNNTLSVGFDLRNAGIDSIVVSAEEMIS